MLKNVGFNGGRLYCFIRSFKTFGKKTINDLLYKGVEIKFLTDDKEKVTKYICKELNFTIKNVVSDDNIEKIVFKELKEKVNNMIIFAK